MNVEVYSIGSEVYFIDNNQKITCGYITEVDFNMKKAPTQTDTLLLSRKTPFM